MNLFAELGPDLPGIEKLRAMKEGNRLTGMEQTLGMRIVEVDDGRVVVEGTPGLHVYNPIGTVHGGYAATLFDNACGYAVQSKMLQGRVFTSLELKVAFHKAITEDSRPLRAEAKVVSISRHDAFTEASLTDLNGKLYASATSSPMVISS